MDTKKGRILKLAVMICTCFLAALFLPILVGAIFSSFIKVVLWAALGSILLIIAVIVLVIWPLLQTFRTPKEDRDRLFFDEIRFNFRSTLIIQLIYTAIMIGPFIRDLQALYSSGKLLIYGLILPFPFFMFSILGAGISILSAFSLLSTLAGFLPLSMNLAINLVQLGICKRISLLKAVILGILTFIPFISLIINILCLRTVVGRKK